MASVSAALLLALAARGIAQHSHTGWLFPRGPLFHGWVFVGVNAATYCWICWIAFWCIRRTTGKERTFIVGFFLDILLWPLERWLPQWSIAIRYVGAFGLAVAILAAIGLLVDSHN